MKTQLAHLLIDSNWMLAEAEKSAIGVFKDQIQRQIKINNEAIEEFLSRQ